MPADERPNRTRPINVNYLSLSRVRYCIRTRPSNSISFSRVRYCIAHMTGGIQKGDIDLFEVKSPIVHRRTLETLAVLTVPSALSPDAENTRTTMSTALTRLLSRFGDDGCRLLPCDSPREIRKIRISGIVSRLDTTREDIEVALPRRVRGESNFNYRVGAVE